MKLLLDQLLKAAAAATPSPAGTAAAPPGVGPLAPRLVLQVVYSRLAYGPILLKLMTVRGGGRAEGWGRGCGTPEQPWPHCNPRSTTCWGGEAAAAASHTMW
jgi:hypothetical protein